MRKIDLALQILLAVLCILYVGGFYYFYETSPNPTRPSFRTLEGRLLRRLSAAPPILLYYQVLHLLYWTFFKGARPHRRVFGALLGMGVFYDLFSLIFDDYLPISYDWAYRLLLLGSLGYIVLNYRYYRSLSVVSPPSNDPLLDDELRV